MKNFIYNDMEFSITKNGSGWDINRKLPNGDLAVIGAGLFKDLGEGNARTRALALVRTVFPVGIKIVGPNVSHPNMVGDLKIIGPDVSHPNFIYWNKDSTSFAK
jgi:hypothetical protein